MAQHQCVRNTAWKGFDHSNSKTEGTDDKDYVLCKLWNSEAELEQESDDASSDDISSYDKGQDAIQVAVPREAVWVVTDEGTSYTI